MTQNVEKISEIQVSYTRPKSGIKLTSSSRSYSYIMNFTDPNTVDYVECFYAIYLSRSNEVLCYKKISQGGYAQTVVDPKIIFGIALKVAASAIILTHNHPSGNLKPSQADISLTDKLKAGAKLLDLAILDHIITTSESYLSMADDGFL